MPAPADTDALTSASASPPENQIVALRDVHKSFGTNKVLKGVSVSIEKGSTVVVMGGSGSGKTVLIKHIVSLLKPDEGEVWVKGNRMDLLEGDALDEIRLSCGYLFQSSALFDSMTVYENMDFLLKRHTKFTPSERMDRIMEALNWVKLGNKAKQYPAELSGGQKKRIALARAIILEPEILLYDEPTTGLDPISVRTVSNLIVRLQEERGISAIAITHDLLCAEIIADHTYFLFQGHIVADGTLDEVRHFDHPEVRNFFGT